MMAQFAAFRLSFSKIISPLASFNVVHGGLQRERDPLSPYRVIERDTGIPEPLHKAFEISNNAVK